MSGWCVRLYFGGVSHTTRLLLVRCPFLCLFRGREALLAGMRVVMRCCVSRVLCQSGLYFWRAGERDERGRNAFVHARGGSATGIHFPPFLPVSSFLQEKGGLGGWVGVSSCAFFVLRYLRFSACPCSRPHPLSCDGSCGQINHPSICPRSLRRFGELGFLPPRASHLFFYSTQ